MAVLASEARDAAALGRRVVVLPIEPGLLCLRCLSPNRLRFELEYGLERGTSANSFLFSEGLTPAGRPCRRCCCFPRGNRLRHPFWISSKRWCPPLRP